MNDNAAIQISNREFLQHIFGDQWQMAHCAVFPDDPEKSSDRSIWLGDWAGRLGDRLESPEENTFFTVSLFNPERDAQFPRRRKELFLSTHVIVIDDIGTKIPFFSANVVHGIPRPSYRLETSPGNEQWGYLLDQPERSQEVVDALQSAVVERLCDGRDPGQKGTTRYVRLPVGANRKAKYSVDGHTPHHRLLEWHPERRFSMAGLRAFFGVTTGTAIPQAEHGELIDVDPATHPVLSRLNVKRRLGQGRYDVTCPWIADHSEQADSGSAVMVREDGSVGYQCHHGHCEARTGNDLVNWLQLQDPSMDVSFQYAALRAQQGLRDRVAGIATGIIAGGPTTNVTPGPWTGSHQAAGLSDGELADQLISEAQRRVRGESYRDLLLSAVSLDAGYQEEIINVLSAHQGVTKQALKQMLSDYKRGARRVDAVNPEVAAILRDYVYVAVPHRFVHRTSGESLKPESMGSLYRHLEAELAPVLLSRDGVEKVTNLNFQPGADVFFERRGARYLNTWQGLTTTGAPGDVSPWWNHLCAMLPDEAERWHLVQWMAYTLQRPEEKINHAVVWGSSPRTGKDTIIWPMKKALGRHAVDENADSMDKDFNSYLAEAKLLVLQEADVAGGQSAKMISQRLKTVIAAPPDELSVNRKGIEAYSIPNLVSVMITTNEDNPTAVFRGDGRYYMLWTDIDTIGGDGNMKSEWAEWFEYLWGWLRQGGYMHVIDWLLKVDVSGFRAKQPPPMTEFKQSVIGYNADGLTGALMEMMREGIIERGKEYPAYRLEGIVNGQPMILTKYGIRGQVNSVIVGKSCRPAGGRQRRTREGRVWAFD